MSSESETALESEWASFVELQLESGRFRDRSEVLQAVLNLMDREWQIDQEEIEELNRKLEEGFRDIRAGRSLTAEEARRVVRTRTQPPRH